MKPAEITLKFDTFDVIQQNENVDEPYIWTFFVKLDGTVLDLFQPDNTNVHVVSPAGSHGNLNLPDDEAEVSDAPHTIPHKVGKWEAVLEQGNLMHQVVPQMCVAGLVVAWEEDMFPSTDAMEEARRAARTEIDRQLTNGLRRLVRECLADPANCAADVDFQSFVSVERLREVIIDLLTEKIIPSVVAAIFVNPLFAIVGDRDDFIGHGLAGPYFLPQLLAEPDHRIDFTLDLKKGEEDTPGHYRVKGHCSLKNAGGWTQLGAAQDDNRVILVGRDTVLDGFYRYWRSGGEWSNNKRIGSGTFTSGPSVAMSADGKQIHVVGRGQNSRFWRAFSNNAGTDWAVAWAEMEHGVFRSAPAVICSNDGKRVYVFGRGKDDRIWFARSTNGGGSFAGWWPIGQGVFQSAPSACCTADGMRISVVATGTDNRAWRALSTDGGMNWQVAWSPILQGLLTSAPAVVSSDDGKRVRVFGRGQDKRIWRAWSDDSGNSWAGWSQIPTGTFLSGPAATMSRSGDVIHLFGIGENMLPYHNRSGDSGANWQEHFSRVDDDSTFY